jgi:acyl carrier protein
MSGRSARAASGEVRMSVGTEVQAMMVKSFELAPDAVHPAAELEKLGVDSLAAIEFMFELEDHFDIRLADERTPIKTVQDVIDIVEKAKNPPAG